MAQASLVLEVVGPAGEQLGPRARKIFGAAGGTIGRDSTNNWVLPDGYVSSHHARIRYEGGGFYIEDISRNGTFLNSQDNRLVKGELYPLAPGDWIFIEPYEIQASIERAGARPMLDSSFDRETVAPPALSGRDDSSGFGILPVPELDVDRLAGAGGGPNPFLDDPVEVVPPGRSLPPERPEHEQYRPPQPLPPIEQAGAAASNEIIPPDWGVAFAPERERVVRPPAPPPPPPPAPPRPAPGGGGAASPPSARVRPAQDAPPAPAPVDVAALLRAAGLDNVEVTPELAADLGRILRVVVAGVLAMLDARKDTKSEFKLDRTMLGPTRNNPLKVSVDVDDALHNLFVKSGKGFLGPLEAFEDAFDDLTRHQLAMLHGLRAAFHATLAQFSPDHLEREFDRPIKKGALVALPARLRYWELYRDHMGQLMRDEEEAFWRLFGDAFAETYERKLDELQAERRERRS